MIMKTFASIFLMASVLLTGCTPEEHIHNEQELITKVRLSFTDSNGKKSIASWSDPDGDLGATNPVADTIRLSANNAYIGTVEVLNETVNPPTNLTSEIQREQEAHLWIYKYDKDNATFSVSDKDKNNQPVGLQFSVETSKPGFGSLEVILKHNADKTSVQPENTGETDVAVKFNVRID